MDRSLSEQGLLETPSYSSLPAVSEGASVPSVSVATAPVSTIGSAAPPIPTAPPPPSSSSALMQLQPQSLNEQSHYSLYPAAASAASTVAGVCVGGGVNIGQLDPLSAHRDSVMPGRRFLWPSVFCSIKIFFIRSFSALSVRTSFTYKYIGQRPFVY